MRTEAVWTYTATNTTLCHAFKDSKALCNKGIKPRTGPAVGSSTGPYVANYITLDDVQNRPYTTACHRCRAKLETNSEQETTVDLTNVDADDIVIELSELPAVCEKDHDSAGLHVSEPTVIGGQCTDCGNGPADHSWVCSQRVKHVRRFTAKVGERDESAELLARRPEQHAELPPTYDAVFAHMADRDRLAKSIAYEFSHIFLTWGASEPTPEKPIIPRQLDRPRMLEFYRNGAIWDAGWLLTEIRNEMDSIIGSINIDDPVNRLDAVNAMTWLGWLHAYVLECGKPGDDGWHNRRREPQDGWEELGLYSTEPSDETELPAWADAEDEQSFGCVAVIAPQGRWGDSEVCGDYVTREEYYAHGSERAMCPRHRLAAELINEQPY